MLIGQEVIIKQKQHSEIICFPYGKLETNIILENNIGFISSIGICHPECWIKLRQPITIPYGVGILELDQILLQENEFSLRMYND